MNDFTFKLLANKDYTAVYTSSGVLGSILTYAVGGWSGILELLLWFFAVDYFSGCIASIRQGKGLKSTIGFFGLCKKGLMLLLVFLGYRIDVALSMNVVMNAVIYFWLANEFVSILENYARLGLKTPVILRKILAILQEKSGETKKETTEEK